AVFSSVGRRSHGLGRRHGGTRRFLSPVGPGNHQAADRFVSLGLYPAGRFCSILPAGSAVDGQGRASGQVISSSVGGQRLPVSTANILLSDLLLGERG